MSKLKPIPPNAKIHVIPGTRYILIDGDKLARLLTPSSIKDGEVYYSPVLKGRRGAKEISIKDLEILK